jgi:hypothetical protein
VHSTPPKPASEFLIAVNRLQIPLMIRDPFVSAAFKAAEDDVRRERETLCHRWLPMAGR